MKNINSILEDEYEFDQFDYQMLIYGNYTYQQNLEADSFVQVIKPVMRYLDSHYKIHYTILTPSTIHSLPTKNVEQVIYKLPTYPNTMRTHFDANKFLKIIDWKRNDFDIIYSHLPEHTNQIANTVYNNTNITPKMIGYSHWFEVPENAKYEKTMFRENISGILEMDQCGVNSDWLKRKVISEAASTFNRDVLTQLERIIQPHYLGVDRVTPRDKDSYRDKTVVFNHRSVC